MLFNFSKTKKFFNRIVHFNTIFFFKVLIFTLLIVILGWSINYVTFPSKGEVLLFNYGNVPAENAVSPLMFKNCRLEDGNRAFPTMFQSGKFVVECENKSFGSLVKPFLVLPVFAEEMVKDTSKKRSKDSKTSGNIGYFKGSKFQFYFYACVGGFMGIGIGLLLILLFYHTQRRSQLQPGLLLTLLKMINC